MQVAFLTLLFIIGACFGSFLCCISRRLHLKSTKHQLKNKRSVCLKCHYKLKWYDNLPIISWLMLRGKCRKCGEKIGLAELLSELGVATAFLVIGLGMQLGGLTIDSILSSNQSPIVWANFGVLLVFVLILSFLAIYDGIYGELPVAVLIATNVCALILIIIREWGSSSIPQDLLSVLYSILILGGTYLVLYLISKGKWVGDGDWILGTAIGLVLGHPWLAINALFIANLTACLIMAPVVKKTHHKKVYFGPFMVIAFVIVYSFADFFYYAIGG